LIKKEEEQNQEIEKIKKDYNPEIEELLQTKEKYSRKKQVNEESIAELKLEEETFDNQSADFDKKLNEFTTEIEGLLNLTSTQREDMKSRETTASKREILNQ